MVRRRIPYRIGCLILRVLPKTTSSAFAPLSGCAPGSAASPPHSAPAAQREREKGRDRGGRGGGRGEWRNAKSFTWQSNTPGLPNPNKQGRRDNDDNMSLRPRMRWVGNSKRNAVFSLTITVHYNMIIVKQEGVMTTLDNVILDKAKLSALLWSKD